MEPSVEIETKNKDRIILLRDYIILLKDEFTKNKWAKQEKQNLENTCSVQIRVHIFTNVIEFGEDVLMGS